MASRRVGRKGESWDGWCIAVCDGIIVVVVEDLLRVLLEGESVRVPLGGRRRVDIAFRIRGLEGKIVQRREMTSIVNLGRSWPRNRTLLKRQHDFLQRRPRSALF